MLSKVDFFFKRGTFDKSFHFSFLLLLSLSTNSYILASGDIIYLGL
jgi:hypothetical protein